VKLIQTVTLGATGTSTLDLINIPQTFTDLVVLASIRTSRSGFEADDLHFRINGSSVNSAVRRLQGQGNSVVSGTADNPPIGNASGSASDTFSNVSIYIPNYTGSAAKGVSIDSVTEHNSTFAFQVIAAHLTDSTSAVTSIGFFSTTGSNFLTDTTISLYGITKGSDGITSVS
jgi:hypothetical protein